VTQLLLAWTRGDRDALDRLVALVSDELHDLALRYTQRERAGHPLQTTALVNEAYLRLVDAGRIDWQDRAHFFAVCANVMRRILVDVARSRRYQKRGEGVTVLPLDEEQVAAPLPSLDVIALDEALGTLATFDPQGARIVELRFFGGLSEEEAAEVIGVSSRTIRREWTAAKTWLMGELTRDARC
jgi:RNA polymerase sigma factor (TIGR02999 family)